LNLPDATSSPQDDPVFQAPWEAQAFALVVQLHERGVFTWDEWTKALAAEIHRDPADGASYYEHWVAALEHLAAAKSLTDRQQLAERRDAWERATLATPHGAPILLSNDPQTRS
jgi:nitrile hydratase accessory protein